MQEMYHRLVKGERDKDIMRALLLSERNYYKYKKKLSKKLEERQKETMESDNLARSSNIEGSYVSIIFSIGRKGQRSLYKNK